MADGSVIYLGDTSLRGAACYLAGLMTRWGWGYSYVPSDQVVDREILEQSWELVVLSDYPAKMLGGPQQSLIEERVAGGAGLLMIGGWDSFRGSGGFWNGSVIEQVLPVQMAATDDRVNCDQPAMISRRQTHPITEGLPWERRPPCIGGFNRLKPRSNANVILDVHQLGARWDHDRFVFEPIERHPLLIVGQHLKGRTAALATDIAPHWVGGLVDWGGTERVTAGATGAYEIEVGVYYAQFLRQLLSWTGQILS